MDFSQALQPLLANFAIISIMVSLWSYLGDYLEREQEWTRGVIFGSLCGISGAIVIQLSFEPVPGFLFDLRCVPIALGAFFGGPFGAILATALTALSRYAAGGAGMPIGILTLTLPLLVGIANHFLMPGRRYGPWRAVTLAASTAAVALSLVLVLPSAVREVVVREGIPQFSFVMTFLGVLLPAAALVYDRNRKDAARINERNTAVIQALPDCLNVKDLDGRFILANEATARLMGASSSADLLGKTDFDFYPPDVAWDFLADEALVMRQQQSRTLQQSFVRPGRAAIWLATLKSPFKNERGEVVGLISHNRDITEQKRLETDLAITQQRLRDALGHMQDGLLMFDRDGRLVLSNSSYKRLFPLTGPLLAPGMSLADLLAAAISTGEMSLPPDVDPASWIKMKLAQPVMYEEFELSGGQWMERRSAPTEDGGWVNLFSDVTARKLSEQHLAMLAQTDGLTGLNNRRTFDEKLYAEFARAYRGVGPLGMVMIDIDHFKAFNDMYGHPAGDVCLQQVANALQDSCRPRDFVARYGGEEFVALFPDTTDDGMPDIAARLIRAVRSLQLPHTGSPKGIVTISAGWAVTGTSAALATPAEFLRLCDSALYRAKGAGRDCARSVPSELPTSNFQSGAA